MADQNWLKSNKVEDIFDPDKAAEYLELFETRWLNLVDAHASMYVVEKVRRLNPDRFLTPAPQHFWSLVLRDFSHEAALGVTNALTEKRKDTLLPRCTSTPLRLNL